MRFTEDHVFFCYGASAGSGSFFQGGKIVRVNYDGTDAKVVAGGDKLAAGVCAPEERHADA
jgi:hypothetical protein